METGIDKIMEEIENEKQNETIYEKVKFEISYFFKNIRTNVNSFFTSLSNFWTFRQEIWNYRWWDYSGLHYTIKSRLQNMHDNWDYAMYVNSEREKQELQDLIQLLDEIEKLEDECTQEADVIIDLKYQEFGRKLFDIQEYTEEFEGKEYTKSFSGVRKFWD